MFFSPQNNGFDSKRITTKILLRIFQISLGNIFISEQARRLGNRSFSKLKISQKPGIEDLSSLEFVENQQRRLRNGSGQDLELQVHQVFIFSDM